MSMLQQLSEAEILQLQKCNSAVAEVIHIFTAKVPEQNRTVLTMKLFASFQLAILTSLGIRIDQHKLEEQLKNDPEAIPELSYLFTEVSQAKTAAEILQHMSRTIAKKLYDIVETSTHILTDTEQDTLRILAQQLD